MPMTCMAPASLAAGFPQIAVADKTPEGVAIGPEFAGKGLVEDDHARGAGGFL
jgi:hypothetical protein